MGKAYKPGTNLTVGSPAILLGSMLSERGITFQHTDPYVEEE
jgi:UDP-N-acetyl-D-mannosaminuronate dehydrogenase